LTHDAFHFLQMRGTNSGVVQEMPSACPAPPGTGLGSH